MRSVRRGNKTLSRRKLQRPLRRLQRFVEFAREKPVPGNLAESCLGCDRSRRPGLFQFRLSPIASAKSVCSAAALAKSPTSNAASIGALADCMSSAAICASISGIHCNSFCNLELAASRQLHQNARAARASCSSLPRLSFHSRPAATKGTTELTILPKKSLASRHRQDRPWPDGLESRGCRGRVSASGGFPCATSTSPTLS